MRLVPVYLCQTRGTRGHANGRDTFQFAPQSSAVTLPQVLEPPDPTSRGNRLDVGDIDRSENARRPWEPARLGACAMFTFDVASVSACRHASPYGAAGVRHGASGANRGQASAATRVAAFASSQAIDERSRFAEEGP